MTGGMFNTINGEKNDDEEVADLMRERGLAIRGGRYTFIDEQGTELSAQPREE